MVKLDRFLVPLHSLVFGSTSRERTYRPYIRSRINRTGDRRFFGFSPQPAADERLVRLYLSW